MKESQEKRYAGDGDGDEPMLVIRSCRHSGQVVNTR